jgi:hypothetical protein
MNTLKDMKQKGRALRKHLEAAFGTDVSLSQAYEALAAMEGATSWNGLSACLNRRQFDAQDARRSFVLDIEVGTPQNRRLLLDICASAWESAVERWKLRGSIPGCEYLIESSDIFLALGDHNVTSTGEEGFDDGTAMVVEDAMETYGYHSRARMLYAGEADINAPFQPNFELSLGEQSASALRPPILESEGGVPPAADRLFSRLAVIEVNLTDVLNEYDEPDDVPDWKWIKEHHSFAHKGNGTDGGVWEFMVRTEKMENPAFLAGMPDTLRPFFERAKADGAAWVMFHQG